MNPHEHHKVETKNAFTVDAGEAIVIYKSAANASSAIALSGENGPIGDEKAALDKSARKLIRYNQLQQIKETCQHCAFDQSGDPLLGMGRCSTFRRWMSW